MQGRLKAARPLHIYSDNEGLSCGFKAPFSADVFAVFFDLNEIEERRTPGQTNGLDTHRSPSSSVPWDRKIVPCDLGHEDCARPRCCNCQMALMRRREGFGRVKKVKATTLDKVKEEHDKQQAQIQAQAQKQRPRYRQQSRYRDNHHDESYNAPKQRGYNNNASKLHISIKPRGRIYREYRRDNDCGNNNNTMMSRIHNRHALGQSSSNLRSGKLRFGRSRFDTSNNNGTGQSFSSSIFPSSGNGRYGKSRYDGNNSNSSNQSQGPSNPFNNSIGF